MKITFVVVDADNSMHLIQHDTSTIKRESFASKTKINVEREWLRFQQQCPDVIKIFTPEDNPYDLPSLIGAIEGAVEWYTGLDEEPWEKEALELGGGPSA